MAMSFEVGFSISDKDDSPRLMDGSLLCVSADNFKTSFFVIVANRDRKSLRYGRIEVILESNSYEFYRHLATNNYVAIESPTYYESYKHTLSAIQEITQETKLPLSRYIVHGTIDVQLPAYLKVKNSKYNLEPIGMPFEQVPSCFDTPTSVLEQVDILDQNSVGNLSSELSLDNSQTNAFLAALSSEVVVIQGPPGTGKSYTGLRIAQALLHNRKAGPMLVIAYKNHALDHFMEGLLRCGIRNMVRIGGNTDSELLDEYRLSEMRRANNGRNQVGNMFRDIGDVLDRTRVLGTQIKDLESGLVLPGDDFLHTVGNLKALVQIRSRVNQPYCQSMTRAGLIQWLDLSASMRETDDLRVAVLTAKIMIGEMQQDFQVTTKDGRKQKGVIYTKPVSVDLKRLNSDPFYCNVTDKELDKLIDNEKVTTDVKEKLLVIRQLRKGLASAGSKAECAQAAACDDFLNISLPEKFKVLKFWITTYIEKTQTAFDTLDLKLKLTKQVVKDRDALNDYEICKSAHVIGLTTTGASKYRKLISLLAPKIVIVEEASEVLEGHLVAALPYSAQHVILLGDHQQLRPIASVYELGRKYNLEISLFERMVLKKMAFYKLSDQHRMRPQISNLLRGNIYAKLNDHVSVMGYPNVPKMNSKNLYFFCHNKLEETTGTSRSNRYEAQFVVDLVRYLVLGPKRITISRITVLTTYNGQKDYIENIMRLQANKDLFELPKVVDLDEMKREKKGWQLIDSGDEAEPEDKYKKLPLALTLTTVRLTFDRIFIVI